MDMETRVIGTAIMLCTLAVYAWISWAVYHVLSMLP